ncbi:hypothetical protein [Cyclobacterium jeungdonense]|uniref:Uncharacterized protein n=1 Tax=Cyclobacterium jeungdonense TaxID=708087 RepID=A0ABT8CCY7_9BACT|nr:hypothetical protein [Cyclobacterium jeungdonense]MDN3689428.1 hypothetical protein [Cyclobacterium jeungdonense]
MKTKYWFYLIAAVVGILIMLMLVDSFTQPGVQDLKGTYQELARYRNENNTGPVIRVFAVYTDEMRWDEMRSYGDFMPHTKYGNTRVFFFERALEDLRLFPDTPYFDEKWQKFCVASYEKTAMGQVNWQRYPFKANAEPEAL